MGSASHQQTRNDVSEVLPKSCCTRWRNEETGSGQAENDLRHTDTGIALETDDVWTNIAVSSQQRRCQNIADHSDIDAWPDVMSHRTSADARREGKFLVIGNIGLY